MEKNGKNIKESYKEHFNCLDSFDNINKNDINRMSKYKTNNIPSFLDFEKKNFNNNENCYYDTNLPSPSFRNIS